MTEPTAVPGSRVLVTGGAAGIGAAIAARCRADGYHVAVIDQKPVPGGVLADLSDPDETAAALDTVLADGPVTRLVNNVGLVRPAPVEAQTLSDMDAVLALNIRLPLQCLQALLPGMKEAGHGRVVNISSRAALGKQERSAYAASKAALIGATRVWALELGRHGITVNAIGPGPIQTDLFTRSNAPDDPRTHALLQGIPVGRVGTPEDVAGATSYFLSDGSGFVTGQTLYVCGGLTIGAAPL
ncbi:SDR family oxidoreductase [Plantactinospora solaniradicis]|uniref:SDR family oxidoreductase n=1 Tax=Plantactinospora solaniradicis TaxID=1723736 RepID=A0ABW1K9X5_9ACTN